MSEQPAPVTAQSAEMVDRTCKKCSMVFAKPSGLRRHEKRKTPCVVVVDPESMDEEYKKKQFECEACKRRFTSRSGLMVHTRMHCRAATHLQYAGAGDVVALREEMGKIHQELTDLRKVSTESQQPVTVGQLNIGSQVTNNNMVLNVFGEESAAHITSQVIKNLLDMVVSEPGEARDRALRALQATALLIYSDPDHPENITCYLPDKRRDEVLVYVGGRWEMRPSEQVLPPMAKRTLDQLFIKQPFEEADRYGAVMTELRDNEGAYATGNGLRKVVVGNKQLVQNLGLYSTNSRPKPPV